MARYRLLTAHWLEVGSVPRLVEAGSEIDTIDLPIWWEPSPWMKPLDEEAEGVYRAVLDKIRTANAHEPGSVPAVGSMHRLPGGDIWEAERRVKEALNG